ARRAGLGRDLPALVPGGGAPGGRRGGAPPRPAGRRRPAAGGGARAGGSTSAGRRHAGRALGPAPSGRVSVCSPFRALRPGLGSARISRRPRLAARSSSRLSRRIAVVSVAAAEPLAGAGTAPSGAARRANSGAPP